MDEDGNFTRYADRAYLMFVGSLALGAVGGVVFILGMVTHYRERRGQQYEEMKRQQSYDEVKPRLPERCPYGHPVVWSGWDLSYMPCRNCAAATDGRGHDVLRCSVCGVKVYPPGHKVRPVGPRGW